MTYSVLKVPLNPNQPTNVTVTLCTQLLYTRQHRTVLIISVIFQTVIIA